jgi:hypothetical protein
VGKEKKNVGLARKAEKILGTAARVEAEAQMPLRLPTSLV